MNIIYLILIILYKKDILNLNNEQLNIVKEKYEIRIYRFNEEMNLQEFCYLYRNVNYINPLRPK